MSDAGWISYGRQSITQADIDAVVGVLQSDFLTQGPCVPQFERAVAEYSGASHAIAMNSATTALHLACLALGLGEGDYLWTSPNTFVASANCARYCGALVDFVDIDPQTYNMSVTALSEKLAWAATQNCLPKIVIPVDFSGQPCDMRAIRALADQYGFFIIEDASHAIGGRYLGKPIGSCTFSDITIFSFHPVKIITTGEGGMALTNQAALAAKLSQLRNHGITRDPSEMTHESEGAWYYQQIDLGFNGRMTEMQAALGLSQLRRLDEFVARRHVLAARYDDLLATFPVKPPWRHVDGYSAFHLYVIGVEPTIRRKVFDTFRANNIGVMVHYIPVHTQPYYARLGFRSGDFPNAEAYYKGAISLPIFFDLTIEQQDKVVRVLKEALQ